MFSKYILHCFESQAQHLFFVKYIKKKRRFYYDILAVYTKIIINSEKHELSSTGIYEAEFSRSCLNFFLK